MGHERHSPEDAELDTAIHFVVRHPRFEALSQDHNGTTVICGVFCLVGPLAEVMPRMRELLERAEELGSPLADQVKWAREMDHAGVNAMWRRLHYEDDK